MTRPINRFLVENGLRIAGNPCVSPDCCLDWQSLRQLISGPSRSRLLIHAKSRFETVAGEFNLAEDPVTGDCAWLLSHGDSKKAAVLQDGFRGGPGEWFFPATWENLLLLKNQVQEHDPGSTIFPTAGGDLAHRTIGVGARFTTLHWPAVEWAMSALEIGVTANQNSIPRELVYDVDAMLEGRLDSVPFPFIGTNVPEGHQGQSVEGMSHACVISKLRTGFHRRRIAWSFNADHQPIGGAFDSREDALVKGCLLASYITFDLSPELALRQPANERDLDPEILANVNKRVDAAGVPIEPARLGALVCAVWPALIKMKRRDEKYCRARDQAFTTQAGRSYIRELSIDELPGLTEPETTAVMLALCESLAMPVQFIAPAFGLKKNLPFEDNEELRRRVERQWKVARHFNASIGFHSGSGKSAENYRVMGEVTGGNLEIKTSGRYTYEMGVALFRSGNPQDRQLWLDWYRFTVELALLGAFSADPTERAMARSFIADSLANAGARADVFGSAQACREALDSLEPSPDHLFHFEYNFLFVLAEGGRAEKAALGSHSAAGYAQRARFYGISQDAKLLFAKGVAGYLVFLAESTALVAAERCAAVRKLLARIRSYDEFLSEISK